MARKRKQYWIDQKKGVIIGRLHELSPGKVTKNPPMVELCSIEEADWESIDGVKKKRPEEERERFIQARRAEALTQIQKKEPIESEDTQTILEAMCDWLIEVEQFKAEATLKEYTKLKKAYEGMIGDHPIRDFNRNVENRFKLGLIRKGIGQNTQHKVASHLQTFLYWASDADLMPRYRMKVPTRIKKEHGVYRPDQIQRMISTLKEDYESETHAVRKRHRMNHLRLFWMLVYTGMRGGEIRLLKLERIDLESGLIHIRRVDEKIAGKRVVWNPKGKKEASIPLKKELWDLLLHDIKNRGKGEVWYLDDGTGLPAYSGTSALGGPIRKLKVRLGVKDVKSLHGFRSTMITSLLDKGASIHLVKELARHEHINMTEAYKNSAKTPLRELVETLPVYEM